MWKDITASLGFIAFICVVINWDNFGLKSWKNYSPEDETLTVNISAEWNTSS